MGFLSKFKYRFQSFNLSIKVGFLQIFHVKSAKLSTTYPQICLKAKWRAEARHFEG